MTCMYLLLALFYLFFGLDDYVFILGFTLQIYTVNVLTAISLSSACFTWAEYLQVDTDMNVFDELAQIKVENSKTITELCGTIFSKEFLFRNSRNSKCYSASLLKCLALFIAAVFPLLPREIAAQNSNEFLVICFVFALWSFGMRNFLYNAKEKKYVQLLLDYQKKVKEFENTNNN